MEQSPIVGYLKAFAFAALAFVLFLAVWQGTKTEDKIVRLDETVSRLDRDVGDLNRDLRKHREALDKLSGANEALLRLIASGGVAVGKDGAQAGGSATGTGSQGTGTGGTGTGTEAGTTGTGLGLGAPERPEWGWSLNASLDAEPDPDRPVGQPGRYANFLRPDPDGYEAPADAPNTTGEIRLPWGPEPKGFNFMLENYATLTDECEIYVTDTPAARHWKRPSSFNWKPRICWRVEVSPDWKEYTLFLRHDVYWQAPRVDVRQYPHLAGDHQVTAHDLAFSLSLIQNRQTDLAHIRSYYDELESWTVVDDYTLVVRWSETLFTSIAQTLAMQILPEFIYGYDEQGTPYPPETIGNEFNDHWFDRLRVGPVGCGPYRFTDYQPGKFVRMDRWDDWYGFKDEPLYPIRTRILRIYNETETAMNWLRRGDLDISGLNATRYRDWVKEETDPKSPFMDGRIHTYIADSTGYLYIGWKNSDPMFADKRVRKALTYACNRQEICAKIFLGRYEPMAAPIYPKSEEADPDLKPYPFDLDKAKQLLDEAGWKVDPASGLRTKVLEGKQTTFEFKLYWPGPNSEFQNVLDHYKGDLLKVGIRMEPQAVQWAQFQQDLQDRKYSAFSLLWAIGGWEHDFMQIWNSEGIDDPGSSNYIEFRNAEVDRLSKELRRIMDEKQRIEVVHRIGRILYEEQPYTFFGWQKVFRSYWDYVKGVQEKRYYIRPFLRSFPLYIDHDH